MHRPKKKHVHKVKAYTLIGLALFVSIWLVSAASPNQAIAEDDASLSELVHAKDLATENELSKPDVVLPIEVIEVTESGDNLIPTTPESTSELNIVVLPKGKHQDLKSKITIVGSSPIDKNSFEESFAILPSTPGTFSVNGRVATFTPKTDLLPQTKYTVIVDKKLRGVKGEVLTQNITQEFTTKASLNILSVPYFRQQYSRSCEAASLRMALAYKGVVVSDMEIVNATGYKPREPDWANRIWDNPYKMFVGYVDGARVGYGTYSSALEKAANHFGRETVVINNPTSTDLAEAVLEGNPVVIWGYISGTVPKLSYFYTEEGDRIPIYSNEHARVITGVVGSKDNPVGFYTHDPLSGKANEYWTVDELKTHMNIFGAVSNQALVVK